MSAVTLQDVSLFYRYYTHPRDALLEWLLRKTRHEQITALQDISFSLEAGSSLGIVGDNGAGKSTLLRLLAGNLQATRGLCQVQGKRAALLELGSGLHPEFSGEENARIGLALRGMNAREIEIHLPEVLAFAELGDFAQQPVKNYSSGMVVRLVFAIAAVFEPEVLIVDEALSVGDQYFQKKSLDRMQRILQGGATLVFCSHNLYQVREICQQALWLEQGRVRMLGDAQTVVDSYQDAVRVRTAQNTEAAPGVNDTPPMPGSGPTLKAIRLEGQQSNSDGLPCFTTHQRFVVDVEADSAGVASHDIHVGIVIRRNDDMQCFGISTLHDGIKLHAQDGLVSVRYVIDKLPLLSGEYCLEVWLIDGSGVHVYDARERCAHFRVQQVSQNQGVGMAWIPHRWEVSKTKSSGKEQKLVTEDLADAI